jgi:hypothetical protein
MCHQDGPRVNERFKSSEVGFDCRFGSLIDATHEREGKLIPDEVERTDFHSLPVNRSLIRRVAVQFYPVVVTHDVENRLTEATQGAEHPTPIGFLRRLDCFEPFRISEQM